MQWMCASGRDLAVFPLPTFGTNPPTWAFSATITKAYPQGCQTRKAPRRASLSTFGMSKRTNLGETGLNDL